MPTQSSRSSKRTSQPALPRGETVNHPSHYGGDTTYEAIKVIEAWGLGFCLGNTIKYICRAPHKGSTVDDLKKARWYLDHEIARLSAVSASLSGDQG